MIEINKLIFGGSKDNKPDETATAEIGDGSAETLAEADGLTGKAENVADESAETTESGDVSTESEEESADEKDPEANNPGLFPVGEPLTGQLAEFFSGKIYLDHIVPRAGAVLNMTFEPGCRTNWHIHHNGGQVLLAVGGAGWYQEEGKEARPLRPGDVVRVPAEIKHWHGAARDTWFSHLLVTIAASGASNAFLEPVEDKEYDALPAACDESPDSGSFMDHLGGVAKLFGKS